MKNIDDILKKKDLKFNEIEKYLEKDDESIYYKMLHQINNFDEEDRKKVCEEIIKKSKNEKVIDRACMDIMTFINGDYDYYKRIIQIISTTNYQSNWINEMKNELIKNSPKTMQFVFEDFTLDKPNNIKFDIQIINSLLYIYDEKYIEFISLKREQIMIACIRLNNIMSTAQISILRIFSFFDTKIRFSKEEIEKFMERFFFDFPYICKRFIKENINCDDSSMFIKYLKEKIKIFDEQEKIKFNMKIFHPDVKRINCFRKYQLEQNKEINKKAKKYSIILDFCKSQTILYGRKYGMTITTNDEKNISIGNMQEFKYEYYYPLGYIIDPVEYMIRINSLKFLEKEE